MEANLDGLLTESEFKAIHMKLGLKRPITQGEVRRLLEHIEILEMAMSINAPRPSACPIR